MGVLKAGETLECAMAPDCGNAPLCKHGATNVSPHPFFGKGSLQNPPPRRNTRFLLEIPASRHWNFFQKSQAHPACTEMREHGQKVTAFTCVMLLCSTLCGYNSDISSGAGIHPLDHMHCPKDMLDVPRAWCYQIFLLHQLLHSHGSQYPQAYS